MTKFVLEAVGLPEFILSRVHLDIYGQSFHKLNRSKARSCGVLYEFSQESLAAMDDAMTGRNLSGPYHTVREAMAALDEELRFTTV